jgi:glycerol-3-phosphate acyltransferase PlsY
MNELSLYLQNNLLISAIICSLAGYLTGAISTARLVYRTVKKTTDYEPFNQQIPNTDKSFDSNLISATWVATKLGKKYGCITGLIDMAKVGIPTLISKLLIVNEPVFLLTAFFGILGHNYPVYYKFRGGRGESPIIGSLLVINWFGIFIASAASSVLGFITGSVLVLRWGWYILMIFWYWIYFNDYRFVLFMVGANFLFWYSMKADLTKYLELKKTYKGYEVKEENVSDFIMMGKKIGRMLDKYGLFHIIKRHYRKKNK